MIDTIVDAAIRLADSIKKNPFQTILSVGLVFLLFQTININDKVAQVIHPSPKQEGEMLGTTIDADTLINDELNRLLEDTGSDRALVRQFKNGTKNLGGIPFAFIKTTHVVIQPGIKPPSYEEYPVSSMNNLMRQMFTKTGNNCVAVTTDELMRDSAFVAYLQAHEVEKGFICPLVSKDKVPMGIVGIGFTNSETTKSDSENLKLVEDASDKIANYLATVRYEGKASDDKKFLGLF